MSHHLPGTQPIPPSQSASPTNCAVSNQVWGWLVPLAEGLDYVQLDKDCVKVGRDPDQCHLVLTHQTFQSLEHSVEKVSRIHLVLYREQSDDNSGVNDLSMNGTFVNKVKVGKGDKMILEHCNVISVLSNEIELFRYLDRDVMERDFPRPVTSKYLVGQVLGDGTTSVVRLGIRREDHTEVH